MMSAHNAQKAGSNDREFDFDITIVLPTYNERGNIIALIEELQSIFKANNTEFEIIVVDDSSPDGTAEAVATAFGNEDNIVIFVRSTKPGLAASIQNGLELSRGRLVLVMDSDFNHQPRDALLLFQVGRHVDICVGSRFILGGGMPSRLHYCLSLFYNKFIRLMLGSRLDENLSGLFTIRRDKLNEIDFEKVFWGYGDYFFRLLLQSQRLKMSHIQVPIMYGRRRSGTSKSQFLRLFIKYTVEVISLTYKRVSGKW